MGKLSLAAIRPPHHKVRESLGELEELKTSLKERGQLQAILVRPVGKAYEVVHGFRRYISAKELGWEEIEAEVRELTNKEAYEIALIENLQRKNMDAIEEAKAFHDYIDTYGYGKIDELAKKISKSTTYILNTIRLLRLPEEIYPHILSGGLKRSHAEEISKLDTKQMNEVVEKVVDAGLTAKETSLAVDLVKHGMATEMAIKTALEFPDMKVGDEKIDIVESAREQIYLTVDKALQDMDFNIKFITNEKEQKEWINRVRYPLHNLKDEINKIRKEFKKR